MSLWRALTTVGGLTAVSRVVGFARDVLTAALLGAGGEADAFFIALRLPDLMRRLFAEGAFSAAFTPQFAAILAHDGRLAALRFVEDALALVLAATLAVVAVGLSVMPGLVALLAPGFAGGDSLSGALAVNFARLTFPYLIPVALAALLGGVLNGVGRMAAFAAAPIVFNLGMLTAFAGVAVWGWSAGLTLSAGVTLAGCLQLLWMLTAAGRAGWGLRLRRPRLTPAIRALLRRLGPGALAVGVGQVNLTVDMMLASLLPVGAVSALAYADRLAQLPLGIVGLALGMALLPRLAGFAAAGDGAGFARDFRQAVLAALALGLPAAVGLALAAGPIIDALFVRGAFTSADGRLAAGVLAGYAVGIPAAVLAKALAAVFFARGDTMTPLRAALATAAANVAFSLALMPLWGAAGIALATSAAALVNLAWLWRGLGATGVSAGLGAGLAGPAGRIVVAAVGMGAVCYGLVAVSPAGWVGLAGILVGGGGGYALLLWAVGGVRALR